MTRRFRRFGAVLLVLLATSAGRAEYRVGEHTIPQSGIRSEAAFEVYRGHPRLYFRDTDLPAIRARVAGDFRPEWEEMRSKLERTMLAGPAEAFAQEPYLMRWELPRAALFVAAVTGEARYVAWARRWMQALVAAAPGRTDNELRGRLQCLAIAYDWLYPTWTEPERDALRAAITAHLDNAWRFASSQVNYVGGHSRYGNVVLAAGLLAVVTERPDLRERLDVVRRNWVEGYWPAQGWIADEGGYPMGWSYSAGYLTGDIHCFWSSATNECAYFPWEAKLPLFWIYGRQGDGFYANTGDVYSARGDFTQLRAQLVIAAGIFKEPHARWLLPPDGDHFLDILYGDKAVPPLGPGDPSAPLALGRRFGNSGVVIARDRWDAQSTVLQFRSVPFYSSNHHHRDENSFTLHYRGGLAIDSGLYDEHGTQPGGYGGLHWLNYYTRTIAHNAIVVYDPTQHMDYQGRPVTNDGGQIFRKEPARLADLQPGGYAAQDGIYHYRDTPEYLEVSGDATKAYDPQRVRLAQRDLVFLRRTSRHHPVVVVFDRVESTRPELRKHFLLHTVNRPEVRGRTTVAENHGGRLSCVTVLPADATLEVIGGPGHEAWVDGANHPWAPGQQERPGIEPGAWRLEVSPAAPRRSDFFLNVLFVDDAGAPAVNAAEVQSRSTAGHEEVRVDGWRVIFGREKGAEPRVERLAP